MQGQPAQQLKTIVLSLLLLTPEPQRPRTPTASGELQHPSFLATPAFLTFFPRADAPPPNPAITVVCSCPMVSFSSPPLHGAARNARMGLLKNICMLIVVVGLLLYWFEWRDSLPQPSSSLSLPRHPSLGRCRQPANTPSSSSSTKPTFLSTGYGRPPSAALQPTDSELPPYIVPTSPLPRLSSPLHARLIFNGKWNQTSGLWVDVSIYHDLLVTMGYVVEIVSFYHQPEPLPTGCIADIQIFFEHIIPEWIDASRYNIFMINQDIGHELRAYEWIDAVVCKSQMAAKLVKDYVKLIGRRHIDVFYVGHTSWDLQRRLDEYPPMPKDFTQFLHVGGKSLNKGTDVVYDTWRRHPEWPMLHIIDYANYNGYFSEDHIVPGLPYNSMANRTGIMIQKNMILYTKRLPDELLLTLQQTSGVHLCPSREEGFGHYINEARSIGAFIMTSDWVPMNELVDPSSGLLIPCRPTSDVVYGGVRLPGSKQACQVQSSGLEEAMQRYFELLTKRDEFVDTLPDGSARVVTATTMTTERVQLMARIARTRYEFERTSFFTRTRDMFERIRIRLEEPRFALRTPW